MPKLVTKEISDLTARSSKPKARRYEIRDAQLRGFMLRVNPSGTKSWYVQLDRHHKRKIGDASVLTASMARFRARDLLQRARHLKTAQKGHQAITLGEFLAGRYSDWIDRRSRFGKRDSLRLKSALGWLVNERIDHVGVSQIERWRLLRAKKVSPATLNREIAALKSALNCAVRWKILSDNPVTRVRGRQFPGPVPLRLLEADERERLWSVLAAREDQISALVITALNTGLSRSELFALRWKDVFFGTNSHLETRPSRSHRNRIRKVPLNVVSVKTLKSWKAVRRNRSTLVFPSPSGGRLKSINTSWARLMKEAEIRNFRLSDCRHDFAVQLVKSGVAITQVSTLLGHSSLSQASRYADFAPGTVREAVEKLASRPRP